MHLKWGEIHPRTMLADLEGRRGKGAVTYRLELAWREFYADVLFAPARLGARQYLRRELARMRYAEPGERSTRGARAAPASRSSTRACASCAPRAGCTTGCG